MVAKFYKKCRGRIIKNEYIAHLKRLDSGKYKLHSLSEHLKGTVEIVEKFSSEFTSSDWGKLAGLWHDLGKYLPEWQNYIRKVTGYEENAEKVESGHPNHSTTGAVVAFERFKQHPIARILAYMIAGHHAGLPDWYHDKAGGDLENRLYDTFNSTLKIGELDQIRSIPEVKKYLSASLPKSAPLSIKSKDEMVLNSEYLNLWIRMLFSCLVDADFLDTENFMNPENQAKRGQYPTIKELADKFEHFMARKQNNLGDSINKPVNVQRRNVLEQCRAKSELPSGFFTLTVPTGGGKTLSSMAFALNHAIRHKKQCIIVAIPYTSIIEQTVKVYKYGVDINEEIKKALECGEVLFGEDAVLEHHSNIDPDKEDDKSRLASENWDAPIIVTTNVQLFESLFASKSSSCRKLHNLTNSVIILDEAQMLPPEYLKPVLSVLKGLVKHYGVTVVLCTATQPALCGKIGRGLAEFEGIMHATEIIDDPDTLAKSLKRVEIEVPNNEEKLEWPDIAKKIQEYDQVLCVVNTRQDCRDLYYLMPPGTVHLSANMCGEERSEIISDIKQKLKAGEKIRVISTQLVEAGVDIDFPAVFRALSGIDSIAQAAGRCNREGKLNEYGRIGKVIVFKPPKPAPVGLLRKGEDATKTVLNSKDMQELGPSIYSAYFNQFYGAVNDFDKPKFKERLVNESGEFKFQFRTFSQDFNLIDDTAQQGIIVWYSGKERNSHELIKYLRDKGPERWILRKLQRFIVNIPKHLFESLKNEGHLEEIHGYWVQQSSGLYKPGLGLLSDVSKWDMDLFI